MTTSSRTSVWAEGPYTRPHVLDRSCEQQQADRRSVAAQTAHLAGGASNGSFGRQLASELGRRARASDDPSTVPFEVFRCGDRDVLLAPGELLMRAADFTDDVRSLLTAAGFDVSVARPAVRDRIVQLPSDLDAGRLDDVTRLLRSRGIQASVNHVTPLGPWAKGEGGPEPTAGVALVAAPAGGAGPPVAVIDTGVNARARDDGWLAGLTTEDNEDPLEVFGSAGKSDGLLDYAAGHGSFACGVVQQVAPDVPVRAYRAINSDGIGSEVAVAEAMLRAVDEGARVINLSLGAQTIDDQPPVAIEVALELIDADIVVVAAAGNFGDTRPVWPAAFRRVVSVAALTPDGRGAPWSSHGFWVELSAVGEGVVSTYVQGDESPVVDPFPDSFGENAWAAWSGTSFAAPQVSALIAQLSLDNNESPRQALARIVAAGVRRPDYGRAVRILPGT